MRNAFPRLDIGPLTAYRKEDFMVERFSAYLEEHQNLVFPHRHSFYHVVLFTAGSGTHSIDFNHFQVAPYQIYFMSPGQIHSWYFEDGMEGYVANFSESFFKSFLLRPDFLDTFRFFDGDSAHGVIQLTEASRTRVVPIFEALLSENESRGVFQKDMIRVLLLQIFMIVAQTEMTDDDVRAGAQPNVVVREFRKLVEDHFDQLRLPGEYAEKLNVTTNHLNALCKQNLGLQAGEVIRKRVVLEAKRLLTNMDLTVSMISDRLNFNDNSYFTKFFRKETGLTPEAFRQSFSG